MPGANDRSIDELYQRPLDEFTAARNDLAKSSGDASIKKLEKPNLAAWAVNQLYWHQRKTYDELIKTSGQLRTAHQQLLAGKTVDLRAPEAFHAEAMRRAKDAIRGILEAAGNTASDAVMTPVAETLDALPTADPPGRLTRPLRRTGFEALQGVTIAARPAKPAAPKAEPSKSASAESERDRKKREADQQARAMAREQLRFAEAAEPVVNESDAHALTSFGGECFGEHPAGVVFVNDVAFEMDVLLGRLDRIEPRRIILFRILQQPDAVAADERRTRGARESLVREVANG